MLTMPSGAINTRYRSLTLLALSYLCSSAALRLALWFLFGLPAGIGVPGLLAILAAGAVNDAVEALYLFVPLSLYLWLVSARFNSSRPGVALMALGSYATLFGMLYLAALEYFFFEEFDSRFNLVAVDYLIYPTEVIGNIEETYPVGPISAAIAGVAAGLFWWLWPRLRPQADTLTRGARTRIFLAHLLLVALAIAFYATDTLARFENRVARELANNGPSSFFAAFRTNQIAYTDFYRTGERAQLRKLLRADLARGGGEFVQPGEVTRRFPARAEGFGKLNIVLISEESLGAEFVGAYGDERALTPEFDALTQQGLLFTQAYATGTRTVRGLEAFSASFPPIPSESVVKRPGNEIITSWGEVLNGLGYHSSFLYGGFGAFDNMNAYFGANGYALSDRADIKDVKFANVWGVSDEDLFMHAIRYYDERVKEGKPFYSIIMSTSNHKPFTFPEGIPGVKPKGGGREAGTRYADYAIGQFFREAQKHGWYGNTVFIVVADHGARVYGAAEIPLFSYEIPLLVIAPGHLAPGRMDTPTSQIDIMPTVLGLLGLGYEGPFFGQDVLHWPAGEPRTLLFNHNHNVALFRAGNAGASREGELTILGLQRSVKTERYRRGPGAARRDNDHFTPMATDEAMADLATAYYQTGYEVYQGQR